MAFEGYATVDEVFARFPPAAFCVSARALDGVNIATGVLLLYGHGLSTDSPVRFSLESSSLAGATAAALPGGLNAGVTYYAQPVADSSDTFKVSATAGGATINSFSSEPVGLWAVVKDLRSMLRAHILDNSEIINNRAAGYQTPFEKNADGRYPGGIGGLCYRMTIRSMVSDVGIANPLYAAKAKSIEDTAGRDEAIMIDWSKGVPIPGIVVDQTPTIVEGGATSWSSASDGATSPDWLNVAGGGLLS